MQANQAVIEEAAQFKAVQVNKSWFAYNLLAIVANNTTLPAFLTIDQDADIMFHSMTGSAYGPTNSAGVRQVAGATDFPTAGTTTGFADRGVQVNWTDTGAGINLTNGFIPIETLFSPGYSAAGLTMPTPFKYYAARNTKLKFDLRNRDTQANLFHVVSITLMGYKYRV